ncbi:MAG: hypothetical protein ACKVWV_01070 [Planctomycetota bacterium]
MLERDQKELQSPNAEPGALDESTALYGSRPAHNARQVDSAKDLPKEWRGAEEAADFLGLEQELRGGAQDGGLPSADVAPDAAAPSESVHWLLNLDETSATAVEPVVPESLRPTIPSDVPQPTGEDAAEIDESELGPFASDDEQVQVPVRSRSWLRAAALLVLVGGGVAAYVYFTRAPSEPAPTVATRSVPPAPRTTEPSVPSTATATIPSDVDGDFDTLAETSTVPGATGTPLMPSPEFERWMRDNLRAIWPGRDVLLETNTDATVFDPLHRAIDVPALRAALAAANEQPDAADVASSEPSPDATIGPRIDVGSESIASQSPVADETIDVRMEEIAPSSTSKNRMRRATKSDLAGIWEGQTIPMDRIGGPTRILTPQVGRVRTILHDGEIFEGRLYAVGQHKVWLDTQLGRMALMFDQLERVDQISSPQGTPALGTPGSQALEGLPRVRVRVPGGMFYGKVTARDERTVTLITDDGARVTLETQDVEPVPATTTVIVRPKKP